MSTRKFLFFDIIEGEEFINNDDIQSNEISTSQENKLKEKNENIVEESNINI